MKKFKAKYSYFQAQQTTFVLFLHFIFVQKYYFILTMNLCHLYKLHNL